MKGASHLKLGSSWKAQGNTPRMKQDTEDTQSPGSVYTGMCLGQTHIQFDTQSILNVYCVSGAVQGAEHTAGNKAKWPLLLTS